MYVHTGSRMCEHKYVFMYISVHTVSRMYEHLHVCMNILSAACSDTCVHVSMNCMYELYVCMYNFTYHQQHVWTHACMYVHFVSSTSEHMHVLGTHFDQQQQLNDTLIHVTTHGWMYFWHTHTCHNKARPWHFSQILNMIDFHWKAKLCNSQVCYIIKTTTPENQNLCNTHTS